MFFSDAFCICGLHTTSCPVHGRTLKLSYIRCVVNFDPDKDAPTFVCHALYIPANPRPVGGGGVRNVCWAEQYHENSWEELKARVAEIILAERNRQ